MLYLFFLEWLLISVSSSCSDGYLTTNNGVCSFYCYETKAYIDNYKDVVSLNVMANQCSDSLQPGLKFNLCPNGKTDLVWPDASGSNGCCPYCGCESETVTATIEQFERLAQKECWSCMCATVPGTTELGYQCDKLYDIYESYNWNDFRCGANTATCEDSIGVTSPDVYYPGQGFFKNQDANSQCTEYCYCKPDGTTTCATGFDNILASTNKGLKGTFLDDNEYYIRDCISDTSRIFTTDTGPTCDRWGNVKCSCPTGKNIGDTWLTESVSRSDGWTGYRCSKCTCNDGSSYSHSTNYVECDGLGSFNAAGQCTESNVNEITCHEGWGEVGYSSSDAKDITGQTVNPRDCATTEPEAYCDWSFDDEDVDDWNWGCGEGLICGVYGTNNGCIKSTFSRTYTDCDGNEHTESETDYDYCCKGSDNCNFKSIDITQCTENTGWSGLLQTLYDCVAEQSETEMFDNDDCNNEYEYESITCTSIKESYTGVAKCYCQAYAGLYQDANTLWQPWIKDQIDMLFESFSQWNEALACDIVLTCDLTVPGGGIRGASAVNRYSAFVASVVVFGLLVVWI